MRQPSLSTNSQHFSSPQIHYLNQQPPTQLNLSQPSHNFQNAPQLFQSPQIKTPKSKRPYKLSKTNPETLTPSKNKERKLSKNSIDKQKNLNQLFGHWNLQENKRYHWFLEVHYSHFMNRSMRRMDRIFTLMAKFVGTREAQQCRSHHQKMQKKHKTFAKILLNLRVSHYETGEFQRMVADMQKNDVALIEPLLSQQALLQYSENTSMILTPKSTISSPQKRQKMIEPDIGSMEKIEFGENEEMNMEEMEQEKEEKFNLIEPIMNNIEEWGLELESSKNYFFKLQMMQGEKKMEQEILLDPDYDNNLDIHNMLFS